MIDHAPGWQAVGVSRISLAIIGPAKLVRPIDASGRPHQVDAVYDPRARPLR